MLAAVIGTFLFLVLLFGAAALFYRRSEDPGGQPLIGTPLPHSHAAFVAHSKPDARPHESSGRDDEDSPPRAT
jgi:hypothetical protein